MNNFEIDDANLSTTFREPEDAPIYRATAILTSEWNEDTVGLSLHLVGGGQSVAISIEDEADLQQFLYQAAVRGKLIKDGEALILMKPVEERKAA